MLTFRLCASSHVLLRAKIKVVMLANDKVAVVVDANAVLALGEALGRVEEDPRMVAAAARTVHRGQDGVELLVELFTASAAGARSAKDVDRAGVVVVLQDTGLGKGLPASCLHGWRCRRLL